MSLFKILAQIELLTGEDARQTPFVSGYRPLFNFYGAPTKISGRIDLINMEAFAPGMSGVVEITFIKGMLNCDYFKVGEVFTFDEGQHLLGKGKIIGVMENGKKD